jgi:GntR family transcriptional regulator of vanillate catabolism
VEQLRTLILSGALPPRQTLRQIEVSERLGVSRTPLREAFRLLEREGFVRISNGNNTLEVVGPSVEEMIELYQVREVIDGLAARLAAQRGVPEDALANLGHLIDEMRKLDSGENWPQRAALHADFHAGIAELSGNRHMEGQISMIRFTAQMLARNLSEIAGTAPDTLASSLNQGEQDHLAILDAIRAGDGRRAETVARKHIRKTMSSPLLRPARRAQATGATTAG